MLRSARRALATGRQARAGVGWSRRPLAILCAGALHEHGLSRLRGAGHTVDIWADGSVDDLCRAAESVDVIVAHGHPIPSEVIDSADRLGLIATTASGAERVAVADASRRGVLVQTTASSGTTAAAEVIISLMFSAARHIVQADASLKAGKWCKRAFEGVELRNKTLCLVGVDPVAAHVATLARALGLRVAAFDPALSTERAAVFGIEKMHSMPNLLAMADVLSLHSPLTKATRGLMGAEALHGLRSGALIINASRRELVHPSALIDVLEDGHVFAAALDFPEDPHAPAQGGEEEEGEAWAALRHHPRCTFTHGLAHGSAARTPEREADDLADTLLGTLQGKSLSSLANATFTACLADEAMQPYVRIAEAMASLHVQTASSPPRKINVVANGPSLRSPAMKELLASVIAREVLGTAVRRWASQLRGVDSLERLNLVNALHVARALGVEVSVTGTARGSPTYGNVVKLSVESRDEEKAHCKEIVGSVLNGEPHIVSIDKTRQFPVFRPRTNVMLIRSKDKPGAVHDVLERLAKHNINIARMGVAREYRGSDAMAVLILDDSISPDLVEEFECDPQLPSFHVASFMDLYNKWQGPARSPFVLATENAL